MNDTTRGYTDQRFTGELPRSDPRAAASLIGDDHTLLVSGFGSVGDPKVVPGALARVDRNLALTVISGGSTGPAIDSDLVAADAVARRYPFQARDESRRAINEGRIAFQDRHIARLGEAVETSLSGQSTAVVEAVAVGEDWLVPSTSIGLTPSFVATADQLIVEVNRAQPLALQQFHDIYRPGLPPKREPIPLDAPGDSIGGPRVRFDPDKLVSVVDSDERDKPYSFRAPTATDEAIITNLLEFLSGELANNPVLSESLTLQVGVGSLGNALMEGIAGLELRGTDLSYFGEVVQDGLLDPLDNGVLSAVSATSLALSSAGQDRLFRDVDRYAEDVVLRPGDVSNRAELIDRFGVVAINSALEIDIYGHANSTHIDGRDLVNGIGGSGDFNRNSHLAVTVLSSRVNDARSRIVPHVLHVDHTEHEIDVVVTEQGVADLRWKSPAERATSVAENCAHPKHRNALREYFERARQQGGHIPFDPETVYDRLG